MLAALTGCTVQTPDGEGKRRSPVHIELPSGTPAPDRTPAREGVFSCYWKSRDHDTTRYASRKPSARHFSASAALRSRAAIR